MKVVLAVRNIEKLQDLKKLIELSQIMAEAMPEYAKKIPKKNYQFYS